MHKAKTFDIGEIVYEDFRELCLRGGDSAPGLDGWSNKDIALLSDKAIRLIVKFLNAIEQGAPWPDNMRQTRAVFLSKDPNDTANPLAYRALKITSTIYRKWGTYRNRTLTDWVMSWDDKAINSGVPGKGATDAWYQTALEVELQRISGQHVSGGSIDIYKCFDQINRELLEDLAIEAGMPKRIAEPYFRFINNLDIRYQIGAHIGGVHRDRCAIPQGCPFSMTMVALIMIPWIRLMRDLHVEPRVLADDLMFTAHGKHHLSSTIRAMKESKDFFQTMGARIADKNVSPSPLTPQ
jgi:hypothetical protein